MPEPAPHAYRQAPCSFTCPDVDARVAHHDALFDLHIKFLGRQAHGHRMRLHASAILAREHHPDDDEVVIDASSVEPMVTWGTNPGQAISITELIPAPSTPDAYDALHYMGFRAGEPVAGTPIDVAFIGSCTNGRLSDLRAAAQVARGRRVASRVRALVVPGSASVRRAAEAEGLDRVFRDAGFEWRAPGCSLCLAMNSDRLSGEERCAASSNRNFKGRQGSPTGRTLLMSPAMVAAAAIAGTVCDVRQFLDGGER